MTSAGMAVLIFLVCFTVFIFVYYPVNKRVESFTINPFPRVSVSSPFTGIIAKLKALSEQVLFYKKAISMGQKVTLNLSLRNSVVRAKSFSAYEEMIGDIEKKIGTRPAEKKIILKMEGYEYLIYSSFTFKDVLFVYKPRITLTDDGYVLRDHTDVAKVILMALNGEGPDINSQIQEQLLSSLLLISQRYGIEVVKTR